MRDPGSPEPGRALRRLLLLLLTTVGALRPGRAVPCVSGGLPKPTNVTFLSINMKNVLQWDPPKGLQRAEVAYTVQYFIYGQKKWLNKSECRNINRTYCDLSAETSDYEQQYYAKVKAIWKTNCSKWAETGRFYPFIETQIGPPEVALSTDEKSISIFLTAPEKWKRNPEDSSVSMQKIYSNLKYNVSVYNTKSKRMWSHCVTNRTLVLSWLEPDTVYCIHVASFVPGPPRLAQPSQKQCIRTLEDPSSALKVKIIFWYVLPVSIVAFLFSVIGYSIYRYIHVGQEKHPANLVLIYGNEFDKRFFVPAEQIMINFITLNLVDDSKVSQKDVSLLEQNNDKSSFKDPEPLGTLEPHPEEEEVAHLGYASHVVEIFCESEEDTVGTPPTPESLSRTIATAQETFEYEYDVRTDICRGLEDHELHAQGTEATQGQLLEPQAALANAGSHALVYSDTPQLSDLLHLAQVHMGSVEESEEALSMTLVDWDPQTGRLHLPSVSSLEQDSQGCEPSECAGLVEDGLLSRLCEEQVPDKAPEENKSYLMQFMEEWGLHVQMED